MLFTTELSAPLLAMPELYGSKLVAAMDRQHPRDRFDVRRAPQAQDNTMENTIENNRSPLPGIDVLNTGYGDFELRFDPDKPDEVQKAKETITDMLKRGYAIFVRQGQETFRVRKFDANKNAYIIGSTPAEEVPIAETKAIAVGRSAGG